MMKISRNRNIGIIVLLLLFGCGKKEKEVVLIERDGVSYEQGAQKPYSGKMSSKYNNGNMKTEGEYKDCLLYTSPSPRDKRQSRMPSSA